MLMEHTTKMRFGPCVTNPNTRDWSLAASLFGSLALQSGGRFELGVGRAVEDVQDHRRASRKTATGQQQADHEQHVIWTDQDVVDA